tara:strand:+ start:4605 stop:5174 length:570 start_codon:yes stop_codon:yes gene_type:complete
MTWWDHETESIWSQPWGTAIAGDLEGTRLKLIPAGIVPWAAWVEEHPGTLVLNLEGYGQFGPPREPFQPGFVIGIALGEDAKAYPFQPASEEGVVNDWIGPFPVVVVADAESKAVHAFLRRAGDRELEFELREGALVDRQTSSTWDLGRGIAVDGSLRGEVLQRVPYITAYERAWEDFYPHSEFYQRSG